MREKNRPFSLNNIQDNLHGKVKKAALTKILDKLSEGGEKSVLTCKEFGSSKVYLWNQN